MVDIKKKVTLGDFVMSNNFIGEIVGLNDSAVSIKTKTSDGIDIIVTSGWNAISRIDLTEEILSKNGFFHNEYNNFWVYEYCDCKRSVMKQIDVSLFYTIDVHTQEKMHFVTVSPLFIDEIEGQAPIKTVDELQHFLDFYNVDLKINA